MGAQLIHDVVSIIVPAYQAEGVLPRALDSVRAQALQDFEVIVIDDASTDGTADIIKHAEKADTRVHGIFLRNNCGPASARNAGIVASSGRFIAFLDADDEWCPEKLIRQVELLKMHPEIDLIFTDAENVYPDSRQSARLFEANNRFMQELEFLPVGGPADMYLVDGPVRRSIYAKCFILPSTVMLRRRSYERMGGFDQLRRGTEDIDLWVRLAQVGTFACWDKVTVLRHVRNQSISSTNERWLRELINYHRACLSAPEYADLRSIARINLLRAYRNLIVFHAMQSSPPTALRVLAESRDLGPQPKLAAYALASVLGPLPFRLWHWLTEIGLKRRRASSSGFMGIRV